MQDLILVLQEGRVNLDGYISPVGANFHTFIADEIAFQTAIGFGEITPVKIF